MLAATNQENKLITALGDYYEESIYSHFLFSDFSIYWDYVVLFFGTLLILYDPWRIRREASNAWRLNRVL